MKKLFISLLVSSVVLPMSAQACDAFLKQSTSSLLSTDSFQKDCEFQDRYAQVKNVFARHGRVIEDVTEYKALRFINKRDYQRNLETKKLAPQKIYDPAPETWEIWESGIEQAMKTYGAKSSLLQKNAIQPATIAHLNKLLMEKDGVVLKDKAISSQAALGAYRSYVDNSSGYCIAEKGGDEKSALQEVRTSIAQFQNRFEHRIGKSFASLVQARGGKWADRATMDPGMNVRDNTCGPQLARSFMFYTPGHMVEYQVDWIRVFVDEVLQSYKNGQPLLAPTELAAVVQKWVVSIHPFVDGNGRTSRGVQDIITRSFSVPFAPAGALQNDALETLETYVQNTYEETDKMLGFLENCAQALQTGQALDYRCKSTIENK